MIHCHHCGAELDLTPPIGRQEYCPRCHGALHSCRNCRFYDPAAHNNCREPAADYVGDPDKTNFCDFYHYNTQGPGSADEGQDKAKAAWEALFGKGKKQ